MLSLFSSETQRQYSPSYNVLMRAMSEVEKHFARVQSKKEVSLFQDESSYDVCSDAEFLQYFRASSEVFTER